MTTITRDEVEQLQAQLESYPEAITALNVVLECNGHLEDAITLLTMREMDEDVERGLSEVVQQCRSVICKEEFRNDLVGGLLGIAIEPVSISVGVPPSVATVVLLYAYKTGMNKFCQSIDTKA
ncbi:hypothetical protein [Phormidesmis sp. 146-33]